VDEAPVWALVNLILSVVGAILAIILTVWVLLQRNQKQKKQPTQEQTQGTKGQYRTNQKQKNEENNDHTVDEKKQKQRRLFWFLLSVILGIAGIVVFLLTEDMTRPMAMVDRWTIVNVIIFVVELIAIALTFKHKNNKDQTVSYTVQYYLQGTRNPVAASKASAFGTVGFSVTEYAPSIVGYTVAGRSTASLTLDKDAAKNVIVFYYTLNTDKDKTEQQK
jgi:H+/gluconate symporter-like permease